MDLQNLLSPQNIASGVGEFFYIAPLSWFMPNGIKKPAPGSIVIEDDFELYAGKGWVKIVLPPRKNQLTANTIGDLGLNKFEQLLSVFIPGSYIEQHEQLKALLNVPLIALCYDGNCPIEYYYVLGREEEAAYFKCDFSTGYTHEGTKGFQATLTATNNHSIHFYEGLIKEFTTYYLVTDDDLFITTDDGKKIEI